MENEPSDKTQVPTKSMNVDILVVGTLNQLYIKGSYTEIKFSEVVSGKTPFFVIGPSSNPLGFWQTSFV